MSQVKNVKNPASQLSAGLLLQASLKFQLEYVVPIQTTYAAENGNSPNSKMVRVFKRKTPCGKPLCSTLNPNFFMHENGISQVIKCLLVCVGGAFLPVQEKAFHLPKLQQFS